MFWGIKNSKTFKFPKIDLGQFLDENVSSNHKTSAFFSNKMHAQAQL